MDVSGGLVSFLQLQGQGPGFHPWAKVAARMLTTANIISSAANLVVAKKQSQGFSIGESCCASLLVLFQQRWRLTMRFIQDSFWAIAYAANAVRVVRV